MKSNFKLITKIFTAYTHIYNNQVLKNTFTKLIAYFLVCIGFNFKKNENITLN